jgi:hypothetical protein
MADDSISESSRPDQNNLTTQHYSCRTPSAHTRRSLDNMNKSQMGSLGEGSSTQGTLSPEVDAHRSSKLHRHNLDRDLRSYYEEQTSTPSKYFLGSQGNENSVSSSDVSQIPTPGELNGAGGMGTRQKRAVGTADEVQPTKRARFSSVNSPWASHRADG